MKAEALTNLHEHERKLRFEPFLWLMQKEKGIEVPEENFRFALAVATYVLENAFHFTEEDMEFYEFLRHVVEKHGREDYWQWIEKSPLPLPDYLKANYDFRDENSYVLNLNASNP
ncbi:hypothetical protein SAMN06265353_1397 [Hydrogenobacter hydrogenophilus]|uniref:Uncharacterized protein n=1 Tax=Hydrogenobacter hydrogenophilus TaxID=35835 RepID=A0A285P1C5_9AQUI|nr:hypothetical protein SAMN06265353_1397 [Hydrogenobacter hydrogenophilus]